MSAADDAAATLAASGLANVVHNALVSAYEQGVASVRGQLDAVQVRYDNAFAEWVAACESGKYTSLDDHYARYQQAMIACAHEWGAIVGHENIP
jgi:hypothetical protein